MWWPFQWLVIYVLGGLTFVPLLIAAIIYYALTYGSVPIGDDDPAKLRKASLQNKSQKDTPSIKSTGDAKINGTKHQLSGWLTVRRQFKPTSGINTLFSSTPQTDLSGAETSKDELEDIESAVSEGASLPGSTANGGLGSGAATPIPSASGTSTPTTSTAPTNSKDTTSTSSGSASTTYSQRIAQTYRNVMESRQKKDAPPKEYFYCVLKGSVLFLYEDEEQSECVAAIGVEKYTVGMEKSEGGKWAGKDAEMFAKRNALVLRLVSQDAEKDGKDAGGKKGLPILSKGMELDGANGHKEDAEDMENRPWFLFSKSNTKMEDWYIALLQVASGKPLYQDVWQYGDMRALVDTIDTEPDPIPMRWFNAMLGRVFFGVYKTAAIEQLIIDRIMKKLSKVPRPSFLGPIVIREVNVGGFPPIFSKPMLKDLTAEGTAAFEVHASLKPRPGVPDGEVRITVATTATIPTGFKPYVVDLVLAVVLKSIEGDICVQIKKPPSNRVWWGFTKMPKLEVEILPVVSERKIQIGMVLRAMEKQLREVIAESVVLPNMDDVAFFDTSPYDIRGGIFSSMGKANQQSEEASSEESSDAPVDVTTSAEDPSSATAELPAIRKRAPTKSQTMDISNTSSQRPTSPSQEATAAEDPKQGVPRTDTAPAGLGISSATEPKRRSLLSGMTTTSVSASGMTRPADSTTSSQNRRTSTDHGLFALGGGMMTAPSLSSSTTLHSKPQGPAATSSAAMETSSLGSGLLGRLSPAPAASSEKSPASDTASIATTSTTTTETAGFGGSTSSLIDSIRTRDKKALQSQVNLARDNLKKGWANFAAKRTLGLKGELDKVDNTKPAAIYRPSEDEVDGEPVPPPPSIPAPVPIPARRSMEKSTGNQSHSHGHSGSMSLKERLDAAAASAGNTSLGRARSISTSSKGSIGTTNNSSRPTLLSSPSKSPTPQVETNTSWAIAGGKPTTGIETTEIVASTGSASGSGSGSGSGGSATPITMNNSSTVPIPTGSRGSRSGSNASGHSPALGSGSLSQGGGGEEMSRKHSGGNSTVMKQPAAGKGMVVPRVPKRPGEVTSLGSHHDGSSVMARSLSKEKEKEKETPPLPPRKSVEEHREVLPVPPPLPPRHEEEYPIPEEPQESSSTEGAVVSPSAVLPASAEIVRSDSAPPAVASSNGAGPSVHSPPKATAPPLPPRQPVDLNGEEESDPASAVSETEPAVSSLDNTGAPDIIEKSTTSTSQQPTSTPPKTKLTNSGKSSAGPGTPTIPSSAEDALRRLAEKDQTFRAERQGSTGSVEGLGKKDFSKEGQVEVTSD